MNNDYKQIYKNTGLVPRTYDQAYNTPDYATGFWKCETPNKKAIKLLISWVVAITMVGLIMFSLYALVYMFSGTGGFGGVYA